MRSNNTSWSIRGAILSRLDLLFVVLALVCFIAPFSFAESRPGFDRYDKLRLKYYSLRNTDLQAKRLSEWESVAKSFEAFVREMPNAVDAPKALLDTASLYEELYRRRGEEGRVEDAIRVLTKLATNFSSSSLADDALERKAELMLEVKGDRDGARAIFEEIIESYPDSDMVELAKVRLVELDGGEVSKSRSDSDDKSTAVNLTGPVIVIDPGHGGEDFGAVGVGGLLEKDVVLAISFELQKILQNELKADVRLTRTKDEFVPLATRMEIANEAQAKVFLSIHANASVNKNVSGTETYYLDNRGDKASHTLADRENASMKFEGGDGGDLSFILSDLIQSGKMPESIKLAEVIQSELTRHLKSRWPTTKNLGVKRGPFYVLVGSHMPCALVEIAFIDNETDGKNLSLPEYRRDVAYGLYKGLKAFLGQ